MCSYLFWTEWGQYPRIEQSRLDGSQRAILVNVSISWPNGISIDYEVQRHGLFSRSYPDATTQAASTQPFVSLHARRRICCTGATPGQTRSSASIWRLERTGRWCWPATTWTCSLCRCLRATSTGATGPKTPHPAIRLTRLPFGRIYE